MNKNKVTQSTTSDIRDNSELDAEIATMRQAYAEAKSTPCEFPGCDGRYHEPGVDPTEWQHSAGVTRFDNGEVSIDIMRTGAATPVAQVWLEGTYDDLTPDGLRQLADLYATLPALMREQAERLEQITREVEAH
ncbi:hypothetical protein [Leifsonia naganoensis]|uniref:Uncharacterized protein n=1 Tax=Leifsonia naganoensis TaxID=150025 RepID=A0A853DSF7_9MICO|nr:hypothetical protein [Leifsonia naganoensis]NYK08585.1 hypothetical protein [Leifsonia naganoensis]